jgi:hypothetical protein
VKEPQNANGHRAIGCFFAFLALLTLHSLKSPGQARFIESWGIFVQMVVCYRQPLKCSEKFFLVKMLSCFYACVMFPLL